MDDFLPIYSDLTVITVTAVDHLGLPKFAFYFTWPLCFASVALPMALYTYVDDMMLFCFTVQNFAEMQQPAAELLWSNDFQYGGRSTSWILYTFIFLFTWCREIEICCCTTNLIKIECFSAYMVFFYDFRNGGCPPACVFEISSLVTWVPLPCYSACPCKISQKSDNQLPSSRQDNVITWQLSAILNFIGLNYYFWSRDCRRVRIC